MLLILKSSFLMKELILELRELNDNFSCKSRRTEMVPAKEPERKVLNESLKRVCK